MGTQLSAPPPPETAAPLELPLPAAGAPTPTPPPPPPAGSERAPENDDDATPLEEPPGQDAAGGGVPLEASPPWEAGSSRRISLRPVYCTVYCVESERRPGGPLASPPARAGEPGGPVASPPSALQADGGERAKEGGGIEVDLYLLSEPFPGLLSGDFGPLLVLACRVCLEEKPLKPLPCCKKAVCDECLKRYLSSQVQVGQADIRCPITECSEHLDETTVLFNLPHDDIIKYKYFLELGRIGSSTKPCPQCKHFTTFRKRGHIPNPTKMENKYKVSMLTPSYGLDGTTVNNKSRPGYGGH